MHLVVNEYGMQMNFIIANGPRADCKEAMHSIENIDAKLVFTNRAHYTNEILSYLNQQNISPVIPPKRNHLHQCDYKGFKEKRQ